MKIDGIKDGIIIDHIKVGGAMEIYHYLNLAEVTTSVAIIKNVKSEKMGKKDIIKIEGDFDINYNVLAYIDQNITVNVIEDNEVVEKKKLSLPNELVDVIKCKNPRCITTVEQEIEHIFKLTNKDKKQYRCIYCDSIASNI